MVAAVVGQFWVSAASAACGAATLVTAIPPVMSAAMIASILRITVTWEQWNYKRIMAHEHK